MTATTIEAEGQTAVFTIDFAACFGFGPNAQNIQQSATTLGLENSSRERAVEATRSMA